VQRRDANLRHLIVGLLRPTRRRRRRACAPPHRAQRAGFGRLGSPRPHAQLESPHHRGDSRYSCVVLFKQQRGGVGGGLVFCRPVCGCAASIAAATLSTDWGPFTAGNPNCCMISPPEARTIREAPYGIQYILSYGILRIITRIATRTRRLRRDDSQYIRRGDIRYTV
jgi:hypothetical protein